jgi:tetratricopeptide (TPR) repeat protein
MVTGDLDKEMEVEELFRQAYPREDEPVNNLAINNAIWLGQFEKAIQLGNQAIRMNPRSAGGYNAITWGYLALNRPDEAKAILEPALKTNPDHRGINDSLFVVYSVLGNEKGARRHLQWASGKVAAIGTIAGGAAGQAARLGCDRPKNFGRSRYAESLLSTTPACGSHRLLDLHPGVGSEFSLAIDSGLAYSLEFGGVPDFIE